MKSDKDQRAVTTVRRWRQFSLLDRAELRRLTRSRKARAAARLRRWAEQDPLIPP